MFSQAQSQEKINKMLFSMKIVQFFDTFRGISPLGMGILMDLF